MDGWSELKKAAKAGLTFLLLVENSQLRSPGVRRGCNCSCQQSIRLLQGENAWIFANEDNVATCVKSFLDFEKELLSGIPKDKRAQSKLTDITGQH